MAALAGPRPISGHYLPAGHRGSRTATHSDLHICKILRSVSRAVVHAGDRLRDFAALGAAGTRARSGTDYLRLTGYHRCGVHHGGAGQLLHFVVSAGNSKGKPAVLTPRAIFGGG